MMRTLLSLLWTDQVGSTQAAEMALVTSVTVGALFMGMADFSATVNRQFQDSAREAGLAGTEAAPPTEEKGVSKKQLEAAKTDEEKADDEKKRNDWRNRQTEARKTSENRD